MIEEARDVGRIILCGIYVVVGIVALTLRALDLEINRLRNERPREDLVVKLRMRHGRLEFERLMAETPTEGVEMVRMVIQAWDLPWMGRLHWPSQSAPSDDLSTIDIFASVRAFNGRI